MSVICVTEAVTIIVITLLEVTTAIVERATTTVHVMVMPYTVALLL